MKATLERVRGGLDATVVIVHDDGDLATCRYLLSEYERHGLSGTVAMIAKRIIKLPSDELNTEAIAEWQSLLERGRFSISCHSRTHVFWGLTNEDEEGLMDDGGEGKPYRCEAGRITREVKDAGELLRAAFPSQRVRTFVKPGFGKHKNGVQISDVAYGIIRRNYVAMRNTGGGVESIPPRDPYNIRSYMVREGECAEEWIEYTEKAIAEHGMIVYLFHNIADSAKGLTVAKSEASRLFSHIGKRVEEGKIYVTSFEEAALYGEELRAAKLTLTEQKDAVTVALEADLDSDVYDVPLTVRIDGVGGEPRAEDGRTVIKRNEAYFVELRLGEKIRLILN